MSDAEKARSRFEAELETARVRAAEREAERRAKPVELRVYIAERRVDGFGDESEHSSTIGYFSTLKKAQAACVRDFERALRTLTWGPRVGSQMYASMDAPDGYTVTEVLVDEKDVAE